MSVCICVFVHNIHLNSLHNCHMFGSVFVMLHTCDYVK